MRGMPVDSVANAVAWYQANVNTGQKGADSPERQTINELRARLIEAQGDGEILKNKLRTLEVAAAEQELIPAGDAHELIEVAIGPVLRALEGMTSALKVKCNPGDPELAGVALKEWSERTRRLCAQALKKTAKKKLSA